MDIRWVVRDAEKRGTLGPGHTIVTLIGDRGSPYFKRLFNPDWLREKGLDTAIE